MLLLFMYDITISRPNSDIIADTTKILATFALRRNKYNILVNNIFYTFFCFELIRFVRKNGINEMNVNVGGVGVLR